MNHIEHLLILASGCVSISAFASAVGILVGITSSAVGLKICVITDGTRTFKSRTKKKRKAHEQIVFLVETKLKFVSAIFYQFFIFLPNDSPSKIIKIFYFI